MITAALMRYWSSDSEKPVPARDLLGEGQAGVPTSLPSYPVGRGEAIILLTEQSEESEER